MKKLPYREGTWFAVPLEDGGYAIGRVARATNKGKVILCYFFGSRHGSLPTIADVEDLQPNNAIGVWTIGDLSLMRKEWPILGETTNWYRSEWPMPVFVRVHPLTGKRRRIYYSDDDPNKEVLDEPDEPIQRELEPDRLRGAGAVEIALTQLLK